jgi:hypothetical protein
MIRTIREYIDFVCDTEGFDASIIKDDYLYDLYEEDYDAFVKECVALGIDVMTEDEDGFLVVTKWAWDHQEY